jgi:deoxyribodipyrimidine photo-lyase
MATLVWFTDDLRIHDNQALYLASLRAEPLICLYCVDEEWFKPNQYGLKRIGEHRWRFLHESLQALDVALKECGQRLCILLGSPVDLVGNIIEQYNISAVFSNSQTGFYENDNWRTLKDKYSTLDFTSVESSTLFANQQLTHIDEFPKTFSKFRHHVDSIDYKIDPLINMLEQTELNLPAALSVESSRLPSVDNSSPKPSFVGGEKFALEHLKTYLLTTAPSSYVDTRNELEGWSLSTKLSPWLANGCLSPRKVVASLLEYERQFGENKSTRWIYFELLWREYFQWYAYHYGKRMFAYKGINNKKLLTSFYPQRFKQWCHGKTPYSIVNACMHQLNKTGYLSNRGRQIVASCLVNELQIDWRCGAAYFEQQLIDYDVASNWGNWQYIAGVGCDPRGGRHFSLQKQTQSYDPQGVFIKKWGGEESTGSLDYIDAADWPI